jgi:hypothetical protein
MHKRRKEKEESITSSSIVPMSSAKILKKAFQLIKKMKQTIVKDMKSVKMTKEVMNQFR